MAHLADLLRFLEDFAPLELAEDWDNVGLLVGRRNREVSRVMTCLTLTSDVAAEAISRRDDLIITHHPVLFRAIQQLTDATVEGTLLLDLIAAGIGVYSPHTSFDSAVDGINQSLAEALGLREIAALRPIVAAESHADTDALRVVPDDASVLGSGRHGRLPDAIPLREFLDRVKAALGVRHLQYVGDDDRLIRHVGVACGAGAEFLADARRHGCDAFLTGEARFHACLEARASDLPLILPGHYATERPAVERLARCLASQFPGIICAPSAAERDPLNWSVP